MTIAAVYKRSRKTLVIIIAAAVFNLSMLNITGYAEPFFNLSKDSAIEKKQSKGKDDLGTEFKERIKKKLPDHIHRRSIYPEDYNGTTVFKDGSGFDIDIAPEDFESHDSGYASEYAFSYGDCINLRGSNFPEWKNFISDLLIESSGETIKDRIKEVELYKILSRYAKSLTTASASVNDDFDYYLPSKNYKKLKEYNSENHDAKIRFDFDAEIRDIRIYLGAKLKINYKNVPEIKLKCFPLDNKVKFEIKEDFNGRKFKTTAECYYNYKEKSITNQIYADYRLLERTNLILQLSSDSDDMQHFENSVLLKTIYRF